MSAAASGLVYLFGDTEIPTGIELRVVSQTNSTVTLGWEPVPGAAGYRFSREGYTNQDGQPRYSITWDSTTRTVRFAKGSSWYRVEALGVISSGEYP